MLAFAFAEDFLTIVRKSIELPPEERTRLVDGGFRFGSPAVGPDDAVVRGAAELATLRGSALSVAEAATLLGVTAARIRQRLSDPQRTLYGIERDGEWLLPRFQFTDEGVIPGIAQVISALDPKLHPVAVLRWLRNENPDLVLSDSEAPLSPLAWLHAGGDPAEAAALAADL
jgi:hypothetical protein